MPTQEQTNKHMCEALKTCFAEEMAVHGAKHIW